MSAALSVRWYAFSAVIALLAASFGFLGSESAQARPSAAHPARPAARGVVVSYPGPGWRTVSPSTTITFRGTPAATLGSVRVVGSTSGLHRGPLVGASDGEGATFHPDKPFQPGERVSVTSAVRVVGSNSNRFSFTVKTPAGQDARPLVESDGQGARAGTSTQHAAGRGSAVRR